MLPRTVGKEGKDWDKLLPYLLFAYREVPQASTGFSPFELLYERSVSGLLDVLKRTWEARETSEESVVSHIVSVRSKLEQVSEIAREYLINAQSRQKEWYDKRARERQFMVGEPVLVLLPTESSKLLARWQGPHTIKQRIGEVNYEVEMQYHTKSHRIFYINMLWHWYSPVEGSSDLVEETGVTDPDDNLITWKMWVTQSLELICHLNNSWS